MNNRSCGRQRDTEASVEGSHGLAARLNRPTRASTEPRKHGPPYRMKMPERVRESQPQLAAAAPTAPRFEARVARIVRCG